MELGCSLEHNDRLFPRYLTGWALWYYIEKESILNFSFIDTMLTSYGQFCFLLGRSVGMLEWHVMWKHHPTNARDGSLHRLSAPTDVQAAPFVKRSIHLAHYSLILIETWDPTIINIYQSIYTFYFNISNCNWIPFLIETNSKLKIGLNK